MKNLFYVVHCIDQEIFSLCSISTFGTFYYIKTCFWKELQNTSLARASYFPESAKIYALLRTVFSNKYQLIIQFVILKSFQDVSKKYFLDMLIFFLNATWNGPMLQQSKFLLIWLKSCFVHKRTVIQTLCCHHRQSPIHDRVKHWNLKASSTGIEGLLSECIA